MKYLTKFPYFPNAARWNFGAVTATGSTVVDSDGSEWRHLCVTIPPVNPAQITSPVTVELKDLLFFRGNFFPDGSETMLYIPRPDDQNAYMLRLWSRVENQVLPAKDGLPKVAIVSEAAD